MTFTRDLETEGHVMVYVTFVIFACIRPTTLNFFLFRKFFKSRNSFQLLPFAKKSLVELLDCFEVDSHLIHLCGCDFFAMN